MSTVLSNDGILLALNSIHHNYTYIWKNKMTIRRVGFENKNVKMAADAMLTHNDFQNSICNAVDQNTILFM